MCPGRVRGSTCLPTFEGVSSVVELQLENIVGRPVGIERGHSGFTSPDEAVLSTEDDERAVDQLHQEQLGLPCRYRLVKVMKDYPAGVRD